MSMTPAVIPNVLANRYATKEMVAIFDPVNKIIAERKFWITILRLQKAGGLSITDSDITSYEKVIEKVDLASIEKRERANRHDVKARIEEFNSLAGLEKIHIGLTSRDLTENIELIAIKDGLNWLEEEHLKHYSYLKKVLLSMKRPIWSAEAIMWQPR
jgi:Adenylosuccinate lyase